MANRDWIPTREQDLVDLCQKWRPLMVNASKVAEYGWDSAEATETGIKVNNFLGNRTVYEGNNSTANRIIKDESKEEAIDAMRDFANSFIRFNKKMRDEDKLPLGIRPGDSHPTPHLRPTSQSDTVVDNTGNHFEHLIRALNRGHRNESSKPADAYGVRYAWQVGGEKPASGADLPKTKFSRKTTFTVTHTEAQKKESFWCATCYENARGECGPWSPVVEAVIG